MGYHTREIPRGVLGEFSKIEEEMEELKDAHDQGVKILELCELSDLYGAIELYLQAQYGMDMRDLKEMSLLTKRAFEDGTR